MGISLSAMNDTEHEIHVAGRNEGLEEAALWLDGRINTSERNGPLNEWFNNIHRDNAAAIRALK